MSGGRALLLLSDACFRPAPNPTLYPRCSATGFLRGGLPTSPCASAFRAASLTRKSTGFIALPLIAYVAIFAGLAVGFGAMQTSRLKSAKAELASFVAVTKAAGEAQEKRTAEIIAQQKRSADEAEKRSKRAVADIRSKYDRLRESGSGRRVLPAIPETTPVADDSARDSRLLSVLQYAEEQTRRLIELQDWIRQQQPIQ